MGEEVVKLQVKVNSQQEAPIVLVTPPTTRARGVWDALNKDHFRTVSFTSVLLPPPREALVACAVTFGGCCASLMPAWRRFF